MGGSLSRCTSINRIKWQSASEELKGGDGEWHASLGRLCAANKKCVSVLPVSQSTGPHLHVSLSLCLPLSLQLPLPRSLSAALSPHRGGCTDTTGAHHRLHHLRRVPLLVFWALFLFLFPPGGCRRGFDPQHRWLCGLLFLFIDGKVGVCCGEFQSRREESWRRARPRILQVPSEKSE